MNFDQAIGSVGSISACPGRLSPMRARTSTRVFHVAAAAFAAISILSGPASAQSPNFGIVDVHAHFLPGQGLTFERAVNSAIRTMDQYGIARTIVMSPPRDSFIDMNYDYPDFLSTIGKHRDRFEYLGGGGSLNPILHRYADPHSISEAAKAEFAQMARSVVDDGARGFGEMSSLHISLSRAHGYSYVPADHPLLLLLADIAAEKNVPIDLHMDALDEANRTPAELAKYPNNPKKLPATTPALKTLLAHNPRAQIIWAHGGTDHLGDFSADAIGTLMDDHPNLHMSLKVVGPKSPTQNKLFDGRGVTPEWTDLLFRHPDRFMIGTDNFYVDSRNAADRSITSFADTNEPRLTATVYFLSLLPPNLARQIASENAIRLFKLDSGPTTPLRSTITTRPAQQPSPPGGLCKDGNMDHCRAACAKGVAAACNILKRGQ